MAKPPLIIVADTDLRMGNILAIEFGRRGSAVVLAEGNEEAEWYARQERAQMIVLDAADHAVNAFDACARIRQMPGYSTIPIVVTAPEVASGHSAAAIGAEATVLLPRPYSAQGLARAVRLHLVSTDALWERLPAASDGTESTSLNTPVAHFTYGANSGLSRGKAPVPVISGQGVRIPFFRQG